MAQGIMLSLSVDLTDEELDELMRALESYEDIEKVEKRVTQSLSAGANVAITLAGGVLALIIEGMVKVGIPRLKKVVKKILDKSNEKSKQKAKLNLNYEELSLDFTSSDDKAIDKKINELLNYMEVDYDTV